jgi:squalene-hopene/tetraprenyl-beta-curcumene cyclase
MLRRSLWPVSLALGIHTFIFTAATLGGENTPELWDKSGAGQYLDRRGEDWFKFGAAFRGQGSSTTSCVSCHSLLPYALARPVLRRLSNESVATRWEQKILDQAKNRVSNWDQLDSPPFQLFYDFDDAKKKQSRGTESVLNALILSLDDRFQGRAEPSDETKKAVAILWSTQITEGQHKGSWEWLNFGMEPWESNNSPFLGACLASIAVGAALGNNRPNAGAGSQAGMGLLRDYLKKNLGSQNLHNQAWMLWAASSMDGLLTPQEKDRLVARLLAKQQSSGGWNLGSLGDFTRGEVKTPNPAPDGYATGLVLHVLQLSGLPRENPQVGKGLSWLRSNQDKTGAWRAASVNKNRAPESSNPAKANVGKFMWDAATGYAVLALSH